MGLRDKARKVFKSSKSDALAKTDTNKTTNSDRDRYPSNVYKPGEPMPRPKYRQPPKKEHKEKLEAFSFADSWRRKSYHSQYSPMGSRMPSRRNSWYSMGRKSFSGRSAGAKTPKSALSRSTSMTSNHAPEPRQLRERDTMHSSGRERETMYGAAIATRLSTEVEQEGDDDVGNGMLGRYHKCPHGRMCED